LFTTAVVIVPAYYGVSALRAFRLLMQRGLFLVA